MKTKTDQIFELTAPFDNPYQGRARRVLFVCSAGILRSATAATIGSGLGMNTRACGSEHYALIPISVNLVNWAQSIFFVNAYNFMSAQDTFREDTDTYNQLCEKSNVWDIEDEYDYMNPELVKRITDLLCL
jgi:predicted protein tyrosine phosphatase